MNETVPSQLGFKWRGVRPGEFLGNHLQIFNGMSGLEQVAQMAAESINWLLNILAQDGHQT